MTGDQYLGSEPNPKGRSSEKVGSYNTLNGNALTGTGVGRSEFVTGNEPEVVRMLLEMNILVLNNMSHSANLNQKLKLEK